jgi:hypothetical protein
MNRSLKDEMRAAVQGDRERAEARRKAEEEGEYTGPPPKLDVNKPTREWKLPAKSVAEEAEVPQPVLVSEGSPKSELVHEESPEPSPPSSLRFLERLQGLFRRTY